MVVFLPTIIILKNIFFSNNNNLVQNDLGRESKEWMVQNNNNMNLIKMTPRCLRFPDKWFVGLNHQQIQRYFLLAKMQLLRTEVRLMQQVLKEEKMKNTIELR